MATLLKEMDNDALVGLYPNKKMNTNQMTKLQKTLCMTALSFLPLTSFASDWSPQLEQARQGDFREPLETFRIKIPSSVSIEVLQTLALELDNIDVTAMVSREGTYALFTPAQPLEWGKHILRLVEYADDGSIFEKGFWEFEVRRSAVFREIDYAADINLVASQRIADKNLVQPGQEEPTGFTGQGGAAFQGRIADDDWQVTGQMDLIYNSEQEQTTNNQEIDLGEYLITGNRKDTQVNLGVHTLAQSSLVMEGFHRRGISANIGFNEINSSAAGFVMRTNEIIGTQNGLGFTDSGNTVNGVVWESQPLEENPEQLYVSATYVSGKSNTSGETVGEAQNTQDGDAWSLIADSTILDQQVRIRGEVASTNINYTSTDLNLNDKSASAYSFLATYSPLPSFENSTFYWNTGIETSEVETNFISLANPNLASDKTLNRFFLNADYKGISSQFSTASEWDNVDDDPSNPQIKTNLSQLTINYSLTEQPEENSLFDTIGIPSISLMWSNTSQDQVKASTTPTEDLDISNDSISLTTSFNKNTWNWSWSYSEMEQDNKINPDQNSMTWSRALNASYQVNEKFVLSPSLQSQATENVFDSGTIDTDIISFGSQYIFNETMNGNVSINQSNTATSSLSNPDTESTSTSLSMQFTWNWILPKNNNPGFDVSLTGSYIDTDDKFNNTNDLETYQVFLSLIMKLPLSSAE